MEQPPGSSGSGSSSSTSSIASSSSTSSFQAITDRSRKYEGLVFFHHMVAGAAAGTMEHTAMYPIDTIKTRMQALSHPGQRLHNATLRGALRSALKREGVSGLYKGVGAVALGAGPAHAIHFGVYEFTKELMGGNSGSGHHPLAAGAAGAIATVVNESIMTPVDVVKQRLQVAHSPYRNVLDCVRKIAATEGLGSFYKSYRTTLIMNIPFQAVHFAIYEGVKKVLLEPVLWRRYRSSTGSGGTGDAGAALAAAATAPPSSSSSSSGGGGGGTVALEKLTAVALTSSAAASAAEKDGAGGGGEEEEEESLPDNLATQLIAGGLAGGVAAALTTPFDVVKTRMQTQGVHSAMKHGGSAVLPAMRRIIQEEGAASLWRGLRPRVLFHVPAAAVCWGTYESLKTFLAAHE